MKKIIETVNKINHWYVGEDCVQIMIPYKNAITILDKTGIIYHHDKDSNIFINKYINDERRKQFPYHNIPTHYNNLAFKGKFCYTNQLLEFEQPYIRINDGHIIENYVVKDKNEALVVRKIMKLSKRTTIKTRLELEKMFEQCLNENEQKYFLFMDGTMIDANQLEIISELEIYNSIKKQLSKNVIDFREYIKNEPHSVVGSYLRKNPLFLNFVEQNIENLNLDKLKVNVPLNEKDTILIVLINNEDIMIKGVDIYFMSYNCYKVDTYEIPITKYTFEQLKYLTRKITTTREPKIPLRLNPGITRQEIKKAKQLKLQKIKNK